MKRLVALITALVTVLAYPAFPVSAEQPAEIEKASSAILIDTATGTAIMGKDENKKVEFAGLSRLPRLLLICEAFDNGLITGDTTVTVSPSAAAEKGATAFLSPNESIAAEELLKASVIITAGDALAALMDAIYPGKTAQTDAINSRLSSLGIECEQTDGDRTLFSASDIAKICLVLSKSESFLKYSSVYLDSVPHEKAADTELVNPNRLVRFYSGCYGLATGSVGPKEYAGAFIAKRGNTEFIAVLAGMPDSASRFALAEEMLSKGFASFRTASVFEEGETAGRVRVAGGRSAYVEAAVKGGGSILLPAGETKVTTEVILPPYVEAPVEEGDELGSVIVKNMSGETVLTVPLYAKSAVPRARFSDTVMELIRNWLRSV